MAPPLVLRFPISINSTGETSSLVGHKYGANVSSVCCCFSCAQTQGVTHDKNFVDHENVVFERWKNQKKELEKEKKKKKEEKS